VNTVQAVFLVGVNASKGAQQKHVPILSLFGGLQIRHGGFHLFVHVVNGIGGNEAVIDGTGMKARGVYKDIQ